MKDEPRRPEIRLTWFAYFTGWIPRLWADMPGEIKAFICVVVIVIAIGGGIFAADRWAFQAYPEVEVEVIHTEKPTIWENGRTWVKWKGRIYRRNVHLPVKDGETFRTSLRYYAAQ